MIPANIFRRKHKFTTKHKIFFQTNFQNFNFLRYKKRIFLKSIFPFAIILFDKIRLVKNMLLNGKII